MTAHLSYLLITVKAIELEKSLLVIWKILGIFVNTLTANDKHSLINRENLTEPIRMQLSEN